MSKRFPARARCASKCSKVCPRPLAYLCKLQPIGADVKVNKWLHTQRGPSEHAGDKEKSAPTHSGTYSLLATVCLATIRYVSVSFHSLCRPPERRPGPSLRAARLCRSESRVLPVASRILARLRCVIGSDGSNRDASCACSNASLYRPARSHSQGQRAGRHGILAHPPPWKLLLPPQVLKCPPERYRGCTPWHTLR